MDSSGHTYGYTYKVEEKTYKEGKGYKRHKYRGICFASSDRKHQPSKLFKFNNLRIDTDGKVSDNMRQRNMYGDPDHGKDNQTSYFQDKIAADEIPYFVIPYKSANDKSRYGKYSYSVGVLINLETFDYIYGVVADNNNKRANNSMGEVSIYAAWNITNKLTEKPDMNRIVTEGKYGIILYANSAPKGGWNVKKKQEAYKFLDKIRKQGEDCYFKIFGQCLNEK